MSYNLTPLDVVECLIAPVHALGEIINVHEKSPYGWRRSSAWRDAGDMPPRANRSLLAHAAKCQIPLTADHLIWGARWDEIKEIVDGMGKTMPEHLQARRKLAMAAE